MQGCEPYGFAGEPDVLRRAAGSVSPLRGILTQKFDTLAGVFTPTLLTILGLIMFLREGWVVGNAGLGGAWLIILLSFSITAATGLSMATIVTNIRVGPGGAFSMISQSLGLEAGGAIGAPLYFSQALPACLPKTAAMRVRSLRFHQLTQVGSQPSGLNGNKVVSLTSFWSSAKSFSGYHRYAVVV